MTATERVVQAITPLIWSESFDGTDERLRELIEEIARTSIKAFVEHQMAREDILREFASGEVR